MTRRSNIALVGLLAVVGEALGYLQLRPNLRPRLTRVSHLKSL